MLPPSDSNYSTRCRKTPYPASLTESEKWSWIRIRNPISTKIKLLLEVHPLLPPTKFGGDSWTRSWDILRTRTDRQTHTQTDRQTDTRRWSQYLAAYGAQVTNWVCMIVFLCAHVRISISTYILTSIVIYLPYRLTSSDATRRCVFVYVGKLVGWKTSTIFYSTFTNVFF